MSFDDYKLVISRNRPDGWVAEIEEEHRAKGQALPRDTTEIVHAWRPRI